MLAFELLKIIIIIIIQIIISRFSCPQFTSQAIWWDVLFYTHHKHHPIYLNWLHYQSIIYKHVTLNNYYYYKCCSSTLSLNHSLFSTHILAMHISMIDSLWSRFLLYMFIGYLMNIYMDNNSIKKMKRMFI